MIPSKHIGIITKGSLPGETYYSAKFNKTYNEYGRIYGSVLNGVRCIQFYARQTSFGGSYMSRYSGNIYGDIFVTNLSGHIRFAVYDNTGTYRMVQSASPVMALDGVWRHVSMHFKAGVGMEMYIDGVKEVMTTTFDLPMRNISQHMYFGARAQVSQYFSDNEMKHIKLWTVHRDQVDVLSDMNSYPTGAVANLKAYFPLKKTGATTFEDTLSVYSGDFVSSNPGGITWIENNMFQPII